MNANEFSAAVFRVIRTRRSIKPADFADNRSIDRLTLEQLLDAANWAPTHGMTEPWRYCVFEGQARLDLGQKLQQIYQVQTPTDQFKQQKSDKLMQSCQQSACVLAIVMHRQPTQKIPEVEEIEAVACSVQNLHLMATALGLAGYWSSGTVICSDAFRDYLGFAALDRVLGLFYLGHPAAGWPEGQRGDWRNKVTWFHDAGPQMPESLP